MLNSIKCATDTHKKIKTNNFSCLVTVRGITPDKTFTDVSLFARDTTNKIVGYWKINSQLLSIGSCGEVIHSSNVEKNVVQAIWQTKSKHTGNVKIQ